MPRTNSISACSHLIADPDDDYYRHFNGVGIDSWLLCSDCHRKVRDGEEVALTLLDRAAVALIAKEGYQDGITGTPSILEQPAPMLPPVRVVFLPGDLVTTLAPLPDGCWLMYGATGALDIFNPDTGMRRTLAHVSLPQEIDAHWCNRHLAPRLLTDPTGRFAALVHDYGRYGGIIDLSDGRVTLRLDGGDYHPETVPFAACFVMHEGRPVLIHRTAWNRLDASDPATGKLLTERTIAPWEEEKRPPHYLDYFHGGLHLSPSGTALLNDGWVWHPLGMPIIFRPGIWLSEDVWETEDCFKSQVLPANENWDRGIAWIDDERIVLGDPAGVALAFLFNLSTGENMPIAGPGGYLFSDGSRLFSAIADGLSVWNVEEGSRTGFIPDFTPAFHHPSRHELVQVMEDHLLCWCYGGD